MGWLRCGLGWDWGWIDGDGALVPRLVGCALAECAGEEGVAKGDDLGAGGPEGELDK